MHHKKLLPDMVPSAVFFLDMLSRRKMAVTPVSLTDNIFSRYSVLNRKSGSTADRPVVQMKRSDTSDNSKGSSFFQKREQTGRLKTFPERSSFKVELYGSSSLDNFSSGVDKNAGPVSAFRSTEGVGEKAYAGVLHGFAETEKGSTFPESKGSTFVRNASMPVTKNDVSHADNMQNGLKPSGLQRGLKGIRSNLIKPVEQLIRRKQNSGTSAHVYLKSNTAEKQDGNELRRTVVKSSVLNRTLQLDAENKAVDSEKKEEHVPTVMASAEHLSSRKNHSMTLPYEKNTEPFSGSTEPLSTADFFGPVLKAQGTERIMKGSVNTVTGLHSDSDKKQILSFKSTEENKLKIGENSGTGRDVVLFSKNDIGTCNIKENRKSFSEKPLLMIDGQWQQEPLKRTYAQNSKPGISFKRDSISRHMDMSSGSSRKDSGDNTVRRLDDSRDSTGNDTAQYKQEGHSAAFSDQSYGSSAPVENFSDRDLICIADRVYSLIMERLTVERESLGL